MNSEVLLDFYFSAILGRSAHECNIMKVPLNFDFNFIIFFPSCNVLHLLMIIILINSIFISTQEVPEVASAVAIVVVVVVVVVVVMGGDGGGGGCGG